MKITHLLMLTNCVFMMFIEGADANLNDLEAMFDKIEGDTRSFARHMEYLIWEENKCSSATANACKYGNYDDCTSEYPEASCPGNDYALPVCGDGREGGCGALFDFTVSTTRLAPSIETDSSGNPKDIKVQQSICYTLQADEYMREETSQNSEYWHEYSVSPPAFLYGAEDGVFRIFPGNPKSCPTGKGDYDPRVRPWYVSASSGPKDIVLVLDTSGSMADYGRIDIMKEAAIRVIKTLGFTDFVSVVIFNTDAMVLKNPSVMIRATEENKESLIKYVRDLAPGGSTDFYKGFSVAFDVINRSIEEEFTSNCRKAIMFLTDGEFNSQFYTTNDFYSMVKESMNGFISADELPPVIFSYSFGDSADETIPKQLACLYDGIWTQIEDDGDLAESMGGFYRYFAYGLGDEGNEDFVAWVSPYEFASGIGLGTTASAPVYDRSLDPPVLVGVVGQDLSFLAMERALGPEGESTRALAIEKLAQRSKAKCPNLQLTYCQLESLRHGSGNMGSRGLCTNDPLNDGCEIYPTVSPLCEDASKLYVWNNHFHKDLSYEERVCCDVGEVRVAGEKSYEEIQNEVCKNSSASTTLIISLSIGGVILLIVVAIACVVHKRKESKNSPMGDSDDVVILPPPTAPHH